MNDFFLSAIDNVDINLLKSLLANTKELAVEYDSDSDLYPIHYATLRENLKIIDILIDHNADINARNCEGLTPIHMACWFGNKILVESLIARGGDAYLKDKKDMTALHYAVESGNNELVNYLIDEVQLDKSAVANKIYTPFGLSIKWNHQDIKENFLKRFGYEKVKNDVFHINLSSSTNINRRYVAKSR